MPLIDDEQEVKRDSMFPVYERGNMGNTLILLSKLYKITSHYLKSVNKYVLCREGECLYCQAYYQKVSQYHYMVDLNGQKGFMDIKASVFFNIQGIARAQRKDTRAIIWTVIKQGEKLDTEYTTSKLDNLPAEDFERIQSELESNTARLKAHMEEEESRLDEAYATHIIDIRQQTPPGSKKKQLNEAALNAQAPTQQAQPAQSTTEHQDPISTNPEDEVNPEDIPF